MSEKYGADAFRYFLIRQKTIGEDGDFSEEDLITRYNNELANTVGNFVHRTFTFIQDNFDGKVPDGEKDSELASKIEEKVATVEKHLEEADVNKALKIIISLAREGNNYFQKSEPWNVDKVKAGNCLYNCANLVDTLAILLYPFIPESSEKVFEIMNTDKGSMDNAKGFRLGSGHEISSPDILFEKIELIEEKEEEEVNRDMISFDEFQDLDIRIGSIEEVEEIEGADNLYKLKIDVGDETKQSAAGLKNHYSPEDLKGRKVPVLVNLEPSELMGVKSECMILAATKDDDSPVLMDPEEDVETGSKVQ